MWPSKLVLAAAWAGTATALLVAEGSSCSQYCGNTLSNTTASDMTCAESGYTSSAGIVFENCINCELTSDYATTDNETDLQWLLYNVRYAVSYCLFGYPENDDFEDNPCITSTACGPLTESVEWDNLTTDTGAYDYCADWNSEQVVKCSACLEAADAHYLNNFFTILDAACVQEPAVGSTLSIQGSVFSTAVITETTPSATTEYTYTAAHSTLSLGGKVGIAIGGFVFLLFVAGVAIVCVGRHRRRAYLKSVAERYNQPGWPSPNANMAPGMPTHEFSDTPMSQKPLRGWDNSPVSASSDNPSFPRYFSPYSSQFNSPVSATDAQQYAWPAAAQMSPDMQAASSSSAAAVGAMPGLYYDPGIGSSSGAGAVAQAYAHDPQMLSVGLALGGTDPSLRSKSSNSNANLEEATATGTSSATLQTSSKDDSPGGESYELREIDSSGAPKARPSTEAPILQHPGYGRGNINAPPPAHPPTLYHGGLVDVDVKNAAGML